MFNILSPQENTNQKYLESPSHHCQIDQQQEMNQQNTSEGTKESNLYILGVGI